MENHLPAFTVPGSLDEYIAALHASKTGIYTETVAAGNLPMRPGVRRLLSEARQTGLRLGIATTTTPANVTALLQHNLAPDAESWFEVIAAGGVVPAKKPAPDIYYYVMQAMGVSAAECLAFEDSENGLRSARAAELQTLVTVSEYTRNHNFDGAVLVLDQLGEPGSPFQVISGEAGGHKMVTVDLLQELHS
jgi:HAD superfamily hydrolase (TIGR01509 family)